ncbi:tRNA (adenosine(37)-N6)-dimethylallyltransferase MiaA [Aestuariimicrobium ganziense]|uniref:tRNA (adenosine(37)-N6)-dimethylallyltransferase MiaA n=1 Tax=Aestuariimicrobium ganziense TaxID=2773677 RepID=UPI002E2C3282|nr:tRNA (adenosine(37)-N6)-dimethylallyltransferase MiaA [Aestuariimicrobium ganziense]
MPTLPVVVLVGPTASGKSSLAVALACALQRRGQPAEVVNTDSMVVYRGMDIGTAKPTANERAGVVHHLVDVLDITRTASVAEFQQMARDVVQDCRRRGVVAILVGGSALYTRAVVDEFEFPGTDPAVRARWQARLDEVGVEVLHADLAERAPEVARDILPGNGRRIVRALEVLELTGGFRAQLPPWTYHLDGVLQFGLRLDREVMDERIAQRVHQMWADGLVDEVRALVGQGLREGRTASRALGYQQVLAVLDGTLGEAEAIEQTITGTRRFARKQLGWYRRDPRITWFDAPADEGQRDELAELLAGLTVGPDPGRGDGPH